MGNNRLPPAHADCCSAQSAVQGCCWNVLLACTGGPCQCDALVGPALQRCHAQPHISTPCVATDSSCCVCRTRWTWWSSPCPPSACSARGPTAATASAAAAPSPPLWPSSSPLATTLCWSTLAARWATSQTTAWRGRRCATQARSAWSAGCCGSRTGRARRCAACYLLAVDMHDWDGLQALYDAAASGVLCAWQNSGCTACD